MKIILIVFGDVGWITGRHLYECFKDSLVTEIQILYWNPQWKLTLEYLTSCPHIAEVPYPMTRVLSHNAVGDAGQVLKRM
jgi:hypothetical protein